VPTDLAKDFCAADSGCRCIGHSATSATSFRDYNYNSTQDIYLANSTAGAPGAFCSIVDGGCFYPDQKWLHCGNDYFNDVSNIIGTLDLPPDVLHSSCKANPNCVGFRVDNSGAKGALLKKGYQDDGLFAITSSNVILPTVKNSKK